MTSKLSSRTQQHEQGIIALALLLVLVMLGSTLLLGTLNTRQNAFHKNQQELQVQLASAKANLLAYAANSAALFGDALGPGFLPCPDTTTSDPDNDGMVVEAYTTQCMDTFGHLPERVQVGATDFPLNNVYSGIDQQFWYAVAANYRNPSDQSYAAARDAALRVVTGILNPTLSLDGTGDYVAFIIAPGTALSTQDRLSNPNDYAAYLDYSNGSSTAFFTSNPNNPTEFNDQLVGITRTEYVRAVAPKVLVALKQELDEYHVLNSTYPPSPGYTNFPAAPLAASQADFLAVFIYDSMNPTDMPAWLHSASASPGTGELWASSFYYNQISSEEVSVVFSGCSGLIFTLHFTDGVTLPNNTSSC